MVNWILREPISCVPQPSYKALNSIPHFQGIQTMKFYGRTQKDESELEILCEASLVADPATLRDLASFLYRCADAIEDQGNSWEHEHFESNEVVSPQFVVFNPNVVDA